MNERGGCIHRVRLFFQEVWVRMVKWKNACHQIEVCGQGREKGS